MKKGCSDSWVFKLCSKDPLYINQSFYATIAVHSTKQEGILLWVHWCNVTVIPVEMVEDRMPCSIRTPPYGQVPNFYHHVFYLKKCSTCMYTSAPYSLNINRKCCTVLCSVWWSMFSEHVCLTSSMIYRQWPQVHPCKQEKQMNACMLVCMRVCMHVCMCVRVPVSVFVHPSIYRSDIYAFIDWPPCLCHLFIPQTLICHLSVTTNPLIFFAISPVLPTYIWIIVGTAAFILFLLLILACLYYR